MLLKILMQYTSIGGQAVIEGVMMRSPKFIAIAVRKPSRKIVIYSKPFVSISQKFPILKKPVLRGVVLLMESLIQGIEALSFSANKAGDDEENGEPLSHWAIAFSILSAFVLGIGLFVALPHFLTAILTKHSFVTPHNPLFHLLDGFLKVMILLVYVYLISRMKDIHRVFQYHGAEHKSIYTFEDGDDLSVQNAKKKSTLHPRCGTSFLLFLILISILIFSIVFPFFSFSDLSSNVVLNHTLMIVVKIFLMVPIAGLAYEFIKICAFRIKNPFFKALIWPGLTLQHLTTKEPSDDQLEVGLASLKQVLALEKGIKPPVESEIEITDLAELGRIQVKVAEFPEL